MKRPHTASNYSTYPMRYTSFVLLLLVVGTLGANYDYYVLATQWAGTICKEQKCSSTGSISTSFFNIHGLWPSQNSNALNPANCPSVSFTSSYFTSTTSSTLKSYWSGLYSSTDSFHDHEWTKHGSCWNNDVKKTNPVDDYFNKVVTLAKKYNAYDILSKSNIKPGKSYSIDSIKNALSSSYKSGNFLVVCSSKNRIQEIRLCLDKNYNPRNCPTSGSQGCSGNVEFPSL